MNKRPSFQFYPADWLKDPQLQMCNMETQGIWINILCRMWEAKEEGKLEGTWQEFARLLGITVTEFRRFYLAAKRHKFADVTNCNDIVTIINRRIYNAFLERERAKKGMRAHRAKQCYEDVTLPSSTSSSSSTTKTKYMSIFDEARKLFKGTKRGLQTEYDYFIKTHTDWKDVLPLLVPAVKQQIIWRAEDGRYWKNFKTWIYNRCWEETQGVGDGQPSGKTKLYPIKGKICSKSDCQMPAVYKDSTGAYDSYACSNHLPKAVKEKYE